MVSHLPSSDQIQPNKGERLVSSLTYTYYTTPWRQTICHEQGTALKEAPDPLNDTIALLAKAVALPEPPLRVH